jgi:hypothetical protein
MRPLAQKTIYKRKTLLRRKAHKLNHERRKKSPEPTAPNPIQSVSPADQIAIPQ